MTRLHELYDRFGQSVWLDNLERRWLASGELARRVEDGRPGHHVEPHDLRQGHGRLRRLRRADPGRRPAAALGVDEVFWQLAEADVGAAADLFRPLYDTSDGLDGYVSLEVDPTLASRTDGDGRRRPAPVRGAAPTRTCSSRCPPPPEGVPAIRRLIGARHQRQRHVDLQPRAPRRGDGGLPVRPRRPAEPAAATPPRWPRSPASSSAASTARSIAASTPSAARQALALRGRAAIAQAQVAYQHFRSTVQRAPAGSALAGGRRPGAATAVGVHLDQEPGLSRHDVRRRADRPRHGQHDAGVHHARRSRTTAASSAPSTRDPAAAQAR